MIALLECGRVVVSIERIEEWGLCDYEDKELIIRKSLSESNKIQTLVHECAHYLFPEFSEKTILSIESDLYKKLTKEERMHLARFVRLRKK